MRSFISILTVLLCVIKVNACSFSSKNEDGVTIYYEINADNQTVSVVSGDEKYNGGVLIPETLIYEGILYSVTSIGTYAFGDCFDLTSITLPNSIISIGERAFFDCYGLTSLTIPSSVTDVGYSAFCNCRSLKTIHIEDGDTELNVYSESSDGRPFRNCPIENLYIGRNLSSKLTADDESLKEVVIGDNVTSIGEYAFVGSENLTTVSIGNSVTSIGYAAFLNCRSLNSIKFGDSISSICDYAFSGCSSLTSIVFPSSSNIIGIGAFEGCNGLSEISVPNSVTEIGNLAFENCSSLEYVMIDDGDSNLELGGDDVFKGCTIENLYLGRNLSTWRVFSNSSSLKEVKIGTYVTAIGELAFFNCTNLTSVEISNSVTEIGRSAFSECSSLIGVIIPEAVSSINRSAFRNCTNLKTLRIENSKAELYLESSRSDYYPFNGCSIKSLYVGRNISSWESLCNSSNLEEVEISSSVTSIGDYAFSKCSGISKLMIPNSVTYIGEHAFDSCNGITSLDIGSSVDIISAQAFFGCSGLTEITIPESVTSIGSSAFKGCSGITTVNFGASECNKTGEKSSPIFGECSNITIINITDRVTLIPSFAFLGCEMVTEIKIPNSVLYLGNNAFDGCKSLKTLIIEDGDSELILDSSDSYNYSFVNCNIENLYVGRDLSNWKALCNSSHLKEVTIGNYVTSIGDFAFSGCSGLMSFIIPNSVTSIGTEAFLDCSGITSLIIPSSVTFIDHSSFYNCTNLKRLHIEDSNVELQLSDYTFICSYVEHLYIGRNLSMWEALCNSSNLKEVVIGNYVTEIGGNAFSECVGLTSVNIPNSVTSIGIYAFGSCSGLKEVNIGNSVTKISEYGFASCTALTSISIPESVNSIGSMAFNNCSSLTEIYSKSSFPPLCEANAFDWMTKISCLLYVPEESLEDYKTAYEWKEFRYIEGYDFPAAIENIFVDGVNNVTLKVYDLNGGLRLVSSNKSDLQNLPVGIYIINGKKVQVQ